MFELSMYELMHPESLAEHQLCEILQNRCIETYNFEKLCKSELLEMYKRVAMPLPQRQSRNVKKLDIEVNATDISAAAISNNDMQSLTGDLNKGSNKRTCQLSQADRLKFPVNDSKLVHKKTRLCSTPKFETNWNGLSKRRCDEQNEESLMKKRQKITWP